MARRPHAKRGIAALDVPRGSVDTGMRRVVVEIRSSHSGPAMPVTPHAVTGATYARPSHPDDAREAAQDEQRGRNVL